MEAINLEVFKYKIPAPLCGYFAFKGVDNVDTLHKMFIYWFNLVTVKNANNANEILV